MDARAATGKGGPGRSRHRAASRVLAALLGVGLSGSGLLAFDAAVTAASPVCAAEVCTVTFRFTGAIAEWEVPEGVSSATLVVEGAGGGGAGGSGSTAEGGAGASVISTLQLTPGSSLELLVGGGGSAGGAGAGAAGGFGGGGSAASATRNSGAGGGGGSFAFARAGPVLVIAGGGGGAATFAEGGAGGHPGADGFANGSSLLIGRGATESGPGAGGAVNGTAGAGPATSPSALGGGGSSVVAPRSGGGGGGGYYGGGSGASEGEFASAGGGGGSDFVAAGSSSSYATGPSGGEAAHAGHPGQITVTYRKPPSTPAPAPTANAAGTTPAGPGGTASATIPSPAPGEPVFSVLTGAPQPLINARMLTFLSNCGPVVCHVSVLATVKLPDGHSWRLSSRPVALAAGTRGAVRLPIPARLRTDVRRYLVHHPHFKVRIDVMFTVRATGVTPVSRHVHLKVGIRTLRHFR